MRTGLAEKTMVGWALGPLHIQMCAEGSDDNFDPFPRPCVYLHTAVSELTVAETIADNRFRMWIVFQTWYEVGQTRGREFCAFRGVIYLIKLNEIFILNEYFVLVSISFSLFFSHFRKTWQRIKLFTIQRRKVRWLNFFH